MDSVADVQAALIRSGWRTVQFTAVDASPYRSLGVREAGLLQAGKTRMEIYRIDSGEGQDALLDYFRRAGLTVMTQGGLVVVIPENTDPKVVPRLEAIGFR